MVKTVVVLGAGHGGIHVSHYLLAVTLKQIPDLRVIIVSPNEEYYWNMASVRAVIPDLLPVDSLFWDISKAFAKYPSDSFEFLLGKASRLEPGQNSVTVTLNDGSKRDIQYHTIIVATGASAGGLQPWKNVNTSMETKAAIVNLSEKIKTAKTIVIGGAGATGVELAGELGSEYGKAKTKEIILVSNSELPLDDNFMQSVRDTVQSELDYLNIQIIKNTKVTHVTQKNGKSILELTSSDKDKSALKADLFIPTYGNVVNTDFAPASWRDETGRLKVDDTLRVPQNRNVFVIGDASNAQDAQASKLNDQVTYLKKQLGSYFTTGTMESYQKNDARVTILTLGRNRGTGQVGTWKMYSLLVWWFKCRYLGLNTAQRAAEGLHV